MKFLVFLATGISAVYMLYRIGAKTPPCGKPVSLMDLPLTDFIRSIQIVQPVRLLGFFLRRQMFWLESQCTDRLHI